MIRLPDNRTCVENSLLHAAIEAGFWPDVKVVVGYGPSYGVGDASKAILGKEGGEIRSNVAPLTLIGVWHRGEVGPWVAYYWWLEITVKEFATRDEEGKFTGDLDGAAMRQFMYDNRFRYELPESLLKYVEGRQVKADQQNALNAFAEAAAFVRSQTGWKEYEHPVYGIAIDEGPNHGKITGLRLGLSTIHKGHALFDHFVATGEILTDLLCASGRDFKTPVHTIQTRTVAELAYLNALPRTVVDGVEYVDMYSRWDVMRAAPQRDETPEGYRYISHFDGGAWFHSGSNNILLTEAWRKAFQGEISLRVNGHLPGQYDLVLEGNSVKYTVLDAAEGSVRIDSIQPFEGLQAADDFLSNRSGRPTQAEARKKVRDAKDGIE